jgi:hypothetical protein
VHRRTRLLMHSPFLTLHPAVGLAYPSSGPHRIQPLLLTSALIRRFAIQLLLQIKKSSEALLQCPAMKHCNRLALLPNEYHRLV